MESHRRSKAPDSLEPVLLEDGGEVRFGDIVNEGAVTKYATSVTRRRELRVPLDDPSRQGLDVIAVDGIRQAHEQYPSADRVDLLARDFAHLRWHAEIQPQLYEHLEENVLIVSVGLEMF